MSNVEKIATSSMGVCPHCHHAAHFAFALQHHLWGSDSSIGRPNVYLHSLKCQGCDEESLIMAAWSPEDEKTTYSLLLPAEAARELPDQVPDGARSLFREASTAEAAGALRAAGVMYRATVEAILKHRGVSGRDLYSKIESLDVPLELKTDLHEARMLGNDSVHDGIEYDHAEVEDVADLIAEACHILYVQPHERASWRERRKARRSEHRTSQASRE